MTATALDVSLDHYIGGRRVPSAERFETRNPYTGEVLAEVARGGTAEVDQAVQAAHDAFPAWAALGPAGRAAHLHRLADALDAPIERPRPARGPGRAERPPPRGPRPVARR